MNASTSSSPSTSRRRWVGAAVLGSWRRLYRWARNIGRRDAKTFPTGNSHTRLPFEVSWLVLDVGSGHNPHPRADVLVDRHLHEHRERAGRPLASSDHQLLVVADAEALPFRADAFDFSIASHILEHLDDPRGFTSEMQRVSRGGYIETPAARVERVRHLPIHQWLVRARDGVLALEPVGPAHPLGRFGKLVTSVYFYDAPQAHIADVYEFAVRRAGRWHPLLALTRKALMAGMRLMRPMTYTRFLWSGSFQVEILPSVRPGSGSTAERPTG